MTTMILFTTLALIDMRPRFLTGESVSADIGAGPDDAARIIARCSVEGWPAQLHARLEVVIPAVDRQIVVEFVLVRSGVPGFAVIPIARDVRQTREMGYSRLELRQFPVILRHHAELSDSQRVQIEIRVASRASIGFV